MSNKSLIFRLELKSWDFKVRFPIHFLGNDRKEIRLMKVYSYSKCGTCRNAIKDLEAKKIKFEVIDITENPPSKKVLKSAVKAKGLQKVFNTSGVQYRELKIKDKIKSMTEAQAIDLLASNGRLIKRPIAVDKNKITIGFNADEYQQIWGK